MRENFQAVVRIVRALIIFGLGVFLILDGIHDRTNVVAKIIVGAVLIGAVHLSDLGSITVIKGEEGARKENEFDQEHSDVRSPKT